MDEGLFRTYFIKLYKSLVNTEIEFLQLIPASESSAFVVFTKGLKELA